MKRHLFLLTVFIPVISAAYAQNTAGPVQQMDDAIRRLAEDIHKKLVEGRAQKITIAQFSYRGTVPPLSAYWVNQLSGELTNIPQRPYTILSGGQAGADRTISGEITEVANVIRIFTRLVRSEDRGIEATFHSDFERNEILAGMLALGGSRSSWVSMDEWEPDSWESPAPYEIGFNENARIINRTLHYDEDEDFFLLLPDKDARLVVETTGGIDTYMSFYDAGTRSLLAENDDGGENYNARIRFNVQAGRRYMVRVTGYDGETGTYGLKAYLSEPVLLSPDEFENDDDSSSANWINAGVAQRHTFHSSDDVEWVKFQITRPGQYTIRARGVNSNRLDTYFELFDANLNPIDEDDDGGEHMDSRLSRRFENGLYYLKLGYLDEEPDQPYTISIEAD